MHIIVRSIIRKSIETIINQTLGMDSNNVVKITTVNRFLHELYKYNKSHYII